MKDILSPLIDACQWILEFWHDLFGGSWGWSIILLTFTVRIAILPLTFKGVKSMQRLQTLQPEIKEIQERYKDDKQRMNQEIMGFYQREKVNPLGSCFPLLLQIPFFISLFYLLRSDEFTADIRDNQGFLAIDNLADNVSDPVLLGVLIVLYVGTQLAASAVTAISADPTQRRIMFALPFVFVIFIINFPAGLIVYWITTNVWTIGQQLLVKKLYPKPEPLDPRDAVPEQKPARGKPAVAASLTDGGSGSKAKPAAKAKAKAKVDVEAWRAVADEIPEEPAERVRAIVGRVVHALGLRATVDIDESDDEIRATVNGDDLGLLIGKHGSTIDAIQHLVFRAAFRGSEDRKQVIADAAGYRERRAAALHRMADRAAAEALEFDRPVELEPMRAMERKVVHTYLSERGDVETHSEGDEPDRRLVVSPVERFS